MMKKILLLLLFLMSASIAPLKGETLLNSKENIASSKDFNTLVQNFNQTGLLLFYLIGDNNLISPFSINSSFLMAYLGANDTTSDEIKKAFDFTLSKEKLQKAYATLIKHLIPSNDDSSQQTLTLINPLWIDTQMEMLPSYQKIVQKDFHTTLKKIDFTQTNQARQTINFFFFDKSKGYIQQFLSPLSLTKQTKLLLTNALFLQKEWMHPFLIKETLLKPFWINQNESKNIEMMHVKASFPYYEDKDVKVLALPFKPEENGPSLLFVLFLPQTPIFSKTFDFFYKKRQKTPERFLSYLNELKNRQVKVQIPKFHSNHSFFLNNVMTSIGIKKAFTPKADFSLMTKSHGLFISRVIHESSISLNEKGIFAGAISGISLDIKAINPLPPDVFFEANRPFLYCIVDANSHLILFIGEYANPSLSISKNRS